MYLTVERDLSIRFEVARGSENSVCRIDRVFNPFG